MAHEVADRREQIRELAGTRRMHKKCLRANCGMLLLSPLQIRFTHDSIGEHSVIELTREKGLLPTWLLDVKGRWENDSAAQSAGSSYDKHSQWKSRGTDAAESTESSCDKHSQWKRGSQDEAEAGLNSTKRWRSRLFAYLKQTFGHHSAVLDYLATGEMPHPLVWEEE